LRWSGLGVGLGVLRVATGECGDDVAASMTAAVSLPAATALPLDRLGFGIVSGVAAER
jgi:hypothetical protein